MGEFKLEPIPFERIAVAVALSPRVEELVSEGFHYAKVFGAKLYFIHIGKYIESENQKLKSIFDKYNFHNIEYEFIFQEGDVVDTLLAITKYLHVDLLVAGALQKESPWKYLMGSISRTICRKAKCSILMLHEPSKDKHDFSKLVVNCIEHPKTPSTIDSAVYLAKHLNTVELILVKEDELSAVTSLAHEAVCEDELLNLKRNQVIAEKQIFDEIAEKHSFEDLNVKYKMLKGKPGKEISHFAREEKADLLVVNSPDQEMGLLYRFFPNGLEHALEDLPCSLLIIHSRTQTANA